MPWVEPNPPSPVTGSGTGSSGPVTVPSVAPIPNTYTPTTTFGAALIDAMGPWMTLHLAWFCDAIGAMADEWWTASCRTWAWTTARPRPSAPSSTARS